MKIIGFNGGQIGDLAINMVALRAIKEKYPDCHFTFAISKKYESVAPVFYKHKWIQDIRIWEGYDNWPTENDKKYIDENDFDLFFSPIPRNLDENWYLRRHHTEQNCLNHNIEPPSNLQIEFNRWFDLDEKYKDCVAIAPFTSAGAPRDVPEETACKIIEHLHKKGVKTIQLGHPSQKQLPTFYPMVGRSVFEDVKIGLSCIFVITADTGINYLLSGYEKSVLGLYSTICYPLPVPLRNRTPVNKNSIYLEGVTVNDIPFSSIANCINFFLNKK